MSEFPEFKKSIEDYLYEEEGNITRKKLLMVGSLAVIMSVWFALDASAGHSSHKSHSSHRSHSSGSGGHSSHVSHSSHESHTSSSLHSNVAHSNHSSSTYSAAVATPAPTPVPTPTPEPMPTVYTPQQTIDSPIMPRLDLPQVPSAPATVAPIIDSVENTTNAE